VFMAEAGPAPDIETSVILRWSYSIVRLAKKDGVAVIPGHGLAVIPR
jgi:hypothetical protein